MKINLENFESVKYKITDDISVEISINNNELTVNTINKQPQKDIAKERFNQLCNASASITTVESQKNSIDLKNKIKSILETKRLGVDKDDSSSPITDFAIAKAKSEFNNINELADDYLKNNPHLASQFKHIGSLDNRTHYYSNVTIKAD